MNSAEPESKSWSPPSLVQAMQNLVPFRGGGLFRNHAKHPHLLLVRIFPCFSVDIFFYLKLLGVATVASCTVAVKLTSLSCIFDSLTLTSSNAAVKWPVSSYIFDGSSDRDLFFGSKQYLHAVGVMCGSGLEFLGVLCYAVWKVVTP
jgi:hypothetical protein